MDSLLEKIISDINLKKSSYKKQLQKYLQSFKGSSNNLLDSSKIKIEIKKIEFDIKNLQKKLGVYVSNQYMKNNAIDYTYDENFIQKVDEIQKLNNYLQSLKNQKNN